MQRPLLRRSFIQSAAATGSFLACYGVLDRARADIPVRITPPVVDKLTIQVVLDSQHDIFISGCNTLKYGDYHFTAEELSGQPQPDQHWHEHATCFQVGDRGLVVITSCGHAGIINTLLRAQEVTGVKKIHALCGGFHLAPAPQDYLNQIMAQLKTFDIDHLIPMHCSGSNFLEAAKREMPEKLILCTTGSRFTFSA